MKYLANEDILVIHALIIDQTGGRHGIRDVGLLESACARPKTSIFGKSTFPTVFDKAAAYLDSIAKHHVFVDGNKRTALARAARFLELNDFRLNASNIEAERFMIRVIVKRLDIPKIAAWLRKHSKRI